METLNLTTQQQTIAKEKLFSRSIKSGSCRLWRGTQLKNGYGQIQVNKKRYLTHRLQYLLHYGPIPDNMVVRHKCDVRNCIAVAHLEIGTSKDNAADRDTRNRNYNKIKLVCPKGHKYSDSNTYKAKTGWRSCRECHNQNERVRRSRL